MKTCFTILIGLLAREVFGVTNCSLKSANCLIEKSEGSHKDLTVNSVTEYTLDPKSYFRNGMPSELLPADFKLPVELTLIKSARLNETTLALKIVNTQSWSIAFNPSNGEVTKISNSVIVTQPLNKDAVVYSGCPNSTTKNESCSNSSMSGQAAFTTAATKANSVRPCTSSSSAATLEVIPCPKLIAQTVVNNNNNGSNIEYKATQSVIGECTSTNTKIEKYDNLTMTGQNIKNLTETAVQEVATVISSAENININKNNERIELSSNYGANRISFCLKNPKSQTPCENPIREYEIISDSYYEYSSNESLSLFETSEFPIIIQTEDIEPGHIYLKLKIVNSATFEIYYDTKNGKITTITDKNSTTGFITPNQMHIEKTLYYLISTSININFYDNNIYLQFITNTGYQITFRRQNKNLAPNKIYYYSVVHDSYKVKNQRLNLYSNKNNATSDEISDTVVLETTEVYPGFLNVTLRAENVYKFEIMFRVIDGKVYNIQHEYLNNISENDCTIGYKLKTIIETAQKLSIDKRNKSIKFFTDNDSTSVIFRRQNGIIPLANNPYLTAQLYVPRYYDIIEGSYQVNGQRLPLFSKIEGPPVVLETFEVYPGRLDVRLTVYNTYMFEINYQIADGWVFNIAYRNSTPSVNNYSSNNISVTDKKDDEGKHDMSEEVPKVETKLIAIIGATEQIGFERDGMIQFITNNQATRVAFKPRDLVMNRSYQVYYDAQSYHARYFNVVANSYLVNDEYGRLFPTTNEDFSITLQINEVFPGRLDVTLTALNTIGYQINYDVKTGNVLSVIKGPSTFDKTGSRDLSIAERKLRDIIEGSQQIVFDKSENGNLQFVASRTIGSIFFKPQDSAESPNANHLFYDAVESYTTRNYTVVEDTYQVNGVPVKLFSSSSLPVVLQTTNVFPGRLEVALIVHDTTKYQINYETAGGSVLNIVTSPSTTRLGSPESLAVENKLKAIIGSTQLIIFDADDEGSIQFVKDYNLTHITFKPKIIKMKNRPTHPFEENETTKNKPKVYNVIESTYKIDDQPISLYPTQNKFPIKLKINEIIPGRLDLMLTVRNTFEYQVDYSTANGWVLNIKKGPSTSFTGSDEFSIVENRLGKIIEKAQQIFFENDGSIVKFITNFNSNSIAFKQEAEEIKKIELQNEVKSKVPRAFNYKQGSYQINGLRKELIDPKKGNAVPQITLQTTEIIPGRLDVMVNVGNNTFEYKMNYATRDGWVLNVVQGPSTSYAVSEENKNLENKIRYIIGTTEQIAFGTDGLIQFISNYNQNRIAFIPKPLLIERPRRKLYYGAQRNYMPKLYDVVSNSYQVKGEKLQLYNNGKIVPIHLQVAIVLPGRLDVDLMIYNSIRYEYHYQPINGNVLKINSYPLVVSPVSDKYEDIIKVEHKLGTILEKTERILFDKNQIIKFITDNDTTIVSFVTINNNHNKLVQNSKTYIPKMSQNINHFGFKLFQPKYFRVNKDSYFINNHNLKLFTNDEFEFPIILQTTEVYAGRLDVILRVHNLMKYQINYQINNFSVDKIFPGRSTRINGPQDMMIVEERLMEIIGNSEKIVVTGNNNIKFIYKLSSITFDRIGNPF